MHQCWWVQYGILIILGMIGATLSLIFFWHPSPWAKRKEKKNINKKGKNQ